MKKIKLLPSLTIFFVLIALSSGIDKNSLDVALVTIDSDPTITVQSLRFDSLQPEPITIAIGQNRYEIPFENISRLELYKKSDTSETFHARINESNGQFKEGTLVYIWNLIGSRYNKEISDDNFYRTPSSFNKIIIINANARPPEYFPEVDNTKIGSGNKINVSLNIPITSNTTDTSYQNLKSSYENIKNTTYVFEIVLSVALISLFSITIFAIKLYLPRTRKKHDKTEGIAKSIPQDARTWHKMDNVLLDQGKYDEAIKVYDEAIANAWYYKGLALFGQDKYDEAIKAFDEAIRLEPSDADAWENKGKALQALNRTTEANEAFAKAKELGYAD